MKRGESYGGGQSSLGYLFESPNDQPDNNPKTIHPPLNPPYGTDVSIDHTQDPKNPLFSDQDRKECGSNSNDRKMDQRGNSLGPFIMGRPTTKVKSVPGGSSSLGYLFGDK